MTTIKPTALPVQLGNIPSDLQSIPRWVCWKYVERSRPDGRKVWAKMPMTTTGRAASSTDPNTWASYDDVVDGFILGEFDGIGLVLGADVQGIDLDDCRDPLSGDLTELAEEVLERVAGYAEVSPSGTGIKLFTKTNLDASRTKKDAGVEMYREGRYFTVTGHQLNGHECLPADVQDVGWFVRKVFDEELSDAPALSEDAAERALLLYKGPLEGWDAARIREEIGPALDLDMHYEDWIRVGQALYHQFEGDDEGFALWDELFQDSPKYGGTEYGWERWRSFNVQRAAGRGPVTLASVLKMTEGKRKEAVRAERDDLLASFKQAIEDCADARDLQDQVAAKIANTAKLTEIEREILAKAIQLKAKALGAASLSIGTVRGWVKSRSGTQQQAPSMPDWAKPWVYITDGDKFFNTESKQEVTSLGFRNMHNRYMPLDQKGSRERADQWAVDFWDMPIAAHKAYMPSAGITFEMFGLQWVNLYRPESVPDVPEELSHEDEDAIGVVQQHLETYLADEREQQLLMSWIAHNVQRPGVKIRWAPYIHGVPGDGKSFFSELVAVAMGGQNVRSLNGSTLESSFTDWAIGYALVAIEEMKQHGHNRFDIMNRLKPFITNTSVEIHPKGRASYTAPNVSNYVIFSNYLDGAPVDEGDRRYMFVSSQLSTAQAAQLTEEGYFKTLFDAIHNHPGAIRKWLLGYQLHPEFNANGRAPDTDVKRTVVELSKSDMELAAEDIIAEGCEGVCREVISSGHLTRAIEARGLEKPSTSKVSTLMTRLGYRMAFAGQKKWRGYPCRIWVQQGNKPSEAEVMRVLNATAVTDDFLG